MSANYLKGSRSPPGISTHLLRSNAAQSPNKNVCSAKKRWLRQAISEDHSDLNDYNGAASPCSETAIDRYIYNIFIIFLFIGKCYLFPSCNSIKLCDAISRNFCITTKIKFNNII